MVVQKYHKVAEIVWPWSEFLPAESIIIDNCRDIA